MDSRFGTRVDMLGLATFCHAVVDQLLKFCDEGQSHADLWIKVRGAIQFLDFFSRFSGLEQGPVDFFPKYGFRGDMSRLSYEQLIVTMNLIKEHEKRVRETRKRLPLILDLRLDLKERRKAAGYCFKLFAEFRTRYLYNFEFPPTIGIPRGVIKLLTEGSEKSKQASKSKAVTKSGGKK